MSHKNARFRMRYISSVQYWTPSNLQTKYARDSDFNIFHALSCRTGGLTIIRHHEIRDFIAANLSMKVCYDACVEPHLQPLSGEAMSTSKNSPSNEGNARLDITASGFGCWKFLSGHFLTHGCSIHTHTCQVYQVSQDYPGFQHLLAFWNYCQLSRISTFRTIILIPGLRDDVCVLHLVQC